MDVVRVAAKLGTLIDVEEVGIGEVVECSHSDLVSRRCLGNGRGLWRSALAFLAVQTPAIYWSFAAEPGLGSLRVTSRRSRGPESTPALRRKAAAIR